MTFNECLKKAKQLGYEYAYLYNNSGLKFRALIKEVDDCSNQNNFVFIPDHKAIYIEDEKGNLLDKYAEVS